MSAASVAASGMGKLLTVLGAALLVTRVGDRQARLVRPADSRAAAGPSHSLTRSAAAGRSQL